MGYGYIDLNLDRINWLSIINRSQKRQEWCGHVGRRRRHAKKDAPVPGKRRRGRQKTWWKVLCNMESVGLKEEDVMDRTKWKRENQNYFGDPR